MKKQISLNKETKIDIQKLLAGRMVILANSGGGKSHTIRKFAEEVCDEVQTIIIDPEGEFSSLREKYDFILAGKNADVPVELRSASLLATRLLELGKSAIIDLYELHPQERQRYVKLFFDAMINAPKELYHPVFIVLDEAHEYAPEGKPSEATWAVEAMAAKGRKRGFCLIPASQRISKLSKNVSAECNNKLIGRASQDIDMKRAGDELGFNKEKLVELRQLKPGEFFAFGPAISDDVIKVKVGEVKTEHAKVGYKNSNKVPPPSHVIKKILGELADLPAEAEKEAKTVAELKKENTDLKRMNTNLLKHPFQKDETYEQGREEGKEAMRKEIDGILNGRDFEWKKIVAAYKKYSESLMDIINTVIQKRNGVEKLLPEFDIPTLKGSTVTYNKIIKANPTITKIGFARVEPTPDTKPLVSTAHDEGFAARTMGKCAQMIASYLYDAGPKNKTQIAIAIGYSRNSGGFNNSISELRTLGMLTQDGDKYALHASNLPENIPVPVDTSLEKWLPKLGACARKIWELLLTQKDAVDVIWTKGLVATETGYSVTSGGFNNSISELSALGLVERMSGSIRINPEILSL